MYHGKIYRDGQNRQRWMAVGKDDICDRRLFGIVVIYTQDNPNVTRDAPNSTK